MCHNSFIIHLWREKNYDEEGKENINGEGKKTGGGGGGGGGSVAGWI